MFAALFLLAIRPARAQEISLRSDAVPMPTPSDYGGIGLIEMRNARFMPDGDISLLGTVKSPDDRIAFTFQALPWLETTFRYSVNYALAPEGQRALYDRSFDVKARLWDEGPVLPAFAVGVQDILGTGVYSGEYFVASKAFGPVDATIGMGWGRLASRSALPNPFRVFGAHFATRPVFSGEGGTPLFNSLFRGQNVGLFGGIEYRTPIPRLTFKIEYSSDAYTRETDRQGLDYAPLPINIGLSYRFWSNVDLAISYIGGKEIAATFNLSFNPGEPNFPQRIDPPEPFVARSEDAVDAARRQRDIASGDAGDESWRVHFVDLTKHPQPNIKAALASAAAEAVRRNDPVKVRAATFKVADHWVEGQTLVVQIHAYSVPRQDDWCSQVDSEVQVPRNIRDIALVGPDWNPIRFCPAAHAPDERDPLRIAEGEPVALGEDKLLPAGDPSVDMSRIRTALAAARITVEGISVEGYMLKLEISNAHYIQDAEAISRAVRALSAEAPAYITAFQITTVVAGMPLTRVTIMRSETDALGDHSASPAELWGESVIEPSPPNIKYPNGPSYPRFTWSIFPNVAPSAFDPDNPLYIGLGVSGSAGVTFFRGFTLSGQATYSLYNDYGGIKRRSNSLLPHVRTDIAQYLKKGASGVDNLTMTYTTKLSSEIYAKLEAGYIESMYAGVGGEVLYRPFGKRWALGLDLWDVQKRDFNRLFGLQDYRTVTGNLTLYFQTPYHGVEGFVSVGRYLARDYGGTVEIDRSFDSGIKVGAWLTLTNVSPKRFGEGSFDKGIRIVIPIEWVLPFSSHTQYQLALRPIQRDGGQPLDNARTLYDTTDSSSYGELERHWTDAFQ